MHSSTTILYIDDEPMNLMLFNLNFNKKYNIILGASGGEGLEILSMNNSVDIVFSDMRMPGINGVEFIRLAKEQYPEISYFILTGYEINDEISEALNSGLIDGYFRKPYFPPELEVAIEKISQNK